MNPAPCRITIFEGPDGGGKTTAAENFALATGAEYVHCGPLSGVTAGNLARMYLEAMLPALRGYRDVVLDRCWLSEFPYGLAFRNGAMRLSLADERMLERAALRCGAIVVLCLPPWKIVARNFASRRAVEMLDSTEQLRVVFDTYSNASYSLPLVHYDYTRDPVVLCERVFSQLRAPLHGVESRTAGHWNARVIVLGSGSVKHTDTGTFSQFPFVSFDHNRLTHFLHEAGVSEQEILWVDTDQPLDWLASHPGKCVALDSDAACIASSLGRPYHVCLAEDVQTVASVIRTVVRAKP